MPFFPHLPLSEFQVLERPYRGPILVFLHRLIVWDSCVLRAYRKTSEPAPVYFDRYIYSAGSGGILTKAYFNSSWILTGGRSLQPLLSFTPVSSGTQPKSAYWPILYAAKMWTEREKMVADSRVNPSSDSQIKLSLYGAGTNASERRFGFRFAVLTDREIGTLV
jgi:hypothetical protein